MRVNEMTTEMLRKSEMIEMIETSKARKTRATGGLVLGGALLAALAIGGCGDETDAAPGQAPVLESVDPNATTAGAASTAAADPTAHVPSGEPIVVVARVTEAPRGPACGITRYAVAVKYQVVRVESGELAEPEILVRTECPELARDPGGAGPITVGDVHRLSLDPTPYRTQRRVQYIPVRTEPAMDVL